MNRWQYNEIESAKRMLVMARELVEAGRELSDIEKQVVDECPDDYFLIFGIQAGTKRYISKTISLLEKAILDQNFGTLVVCHSRFNFSLKELGAMNGLVGVRSSEKRREKRWRRVERRIAEKEKTNGNSCAA